MSNLQQQRIIVDQLRREAAIKRINVSQAVEDIKVNISIKNKYAESKLQKIVHIFLQFFVIDFYAFFI